MRCPPAFRIRRCARGALLVFGMWGVQGASAEPAAASDEAVRFQYWAPSGCPEAAIFEERVRLRTTRGRLAQEGELARTFRVTIAREIEGFSGTVQFTDAAGANVSRRVSGAGCDEVVSGTALVTALALDARLTTTPLPEPGAVAEPPPAAAPERARAGPALPSPPGARQTAPPPPAAIQASEIARASAGVGGAYETPLDAPALGLIGQLRWRSGLSLRLLAHYATDERSVDPGRRAELRLLGIEASACPSRERAGPFRLYGCLGLDLGSLRARGIRADLLTKAGSRTIFWAAAAAQLRLAWEPEAPFWLELNGGVAFPLVRETFVFEAPRATVFEVPLVSARIQIASGVHFW